MRRDECPTCRRDILTGQARCFINHDGEVEELRTAYVNVTGEGGKDSMTVAWTPVGPAMPGVSVITFIQELPDPRYKNGIIHTEVTITLCRKTMQRIVDEIFKGQPG